ncbi:MAG: NAD(P)-binding domain-containing protein, partial [Candidatus Rokubacteria bacterium]|nr:NAD(P)-binding domain-containing protein [Candidatus Rokubacteria bacterium]
MQRLGFIGTGGMGRPMAANLLKAGFTLTVHDVRREATAPLEEQGAKVAHSPRQVAEQSDVVLSMLPVNEAVHAVAAGPGGLTETLAGARVWIDFSSVDRNTILRAEAALRPKG